MVVLLALQDDIFLLVEDKNLYLQPFHLYMVIAELVIDTTQ